MNGDHPETRVTEELVARARHGDPDAYDRLFALAAERAMAFIRLRLGAGLRSELDSLDVLQDAYLEAHRDFGQFEFRGDGSFGAWLCRIIDHRIRGLAEHFGAQKRRPDGDRVPVSDVADRVRALTGPATAAMRGERQEALARAMDALAEDERHAVLLRFFEDLTLDDLAKEMGRSPSAVRRLVARATARLGSLLRTTAGGTP